MFLNNKKTLISPALFYGNSFAISFTKKTELFNSFFAKQCTVINKGDSLPSELLLKTDQFWPKIIFSSDDILKIIQNLDSEKAYGHDRMSIRMLKIWGPSICKPLEIIFKSCLESGISTGMEKRECCSSSYKNDKQSLENYWPTSLLLRYGKYLNVCYMTRCSGFS